MIKNLILDIDNTLVQTHQNNIFDNFDESKFNGLIWSIITINNLQNRMFHRPGLLEFLKFCCENFNVSIWSAGTPDYVESVVNELFITPLDI
jgi:FMN phosphatase YigB (HAD superfamily)